MYARGILFGKMKYELGDHSYVRCPETGLAVDVEFKVKGYFGGAYNAIGGTIKNEKTGEALYELSGSWHSEMTIKNLQVMTRKGRYSSLLTFFRLGRRKSCLTQKGHSTHHPKSDRSRSRWIPNRKSYG